MKQWIYVYWDSDSYLVMRQTLAQTPSHARVQSTIIAKGRHQMTAALPYTSPAYYHQYAAVQMQIGNQYATEQWPLRTCVDFAVKQSNN